MADSSLVLTQDIGIYTCKAALFSFDGSMLRSNIVSYCPEKNGQGYSWQSPQLWWDAFCRNCRTLLAGIDPGRVKAVCLCGQTLGCMAVDSDAVPLQGHVTWDDTRASEEVEQIGQIFGYPQLHQITGLCPGQAHMLPIILWFMKHQPDIYRRTYKFLSCKDYINYKLTGRIATDETCAGFTQMYDLLQERWSNTILDAFHIDREKLPEVVPFGTVLGELTPEAAAQCGLTQDTAVVQGMGDGRAPAVGAGLLHPGEGYINLGSSSWVSQITADPVMDQEHSLTKTVYHSGLYSNGGSSIAGRLCLDWYINTFSSAENHVSNDAIGPFLARQFINSPVGSNGLLFLPYLRGALTPWCDQFAKGGFIGLSTKHTKYDFCRSILEGVSFQLTIIKNRVERLSPFTSMRIVESAVFPEWQQILSDTFEMEIVSSDLSAFAGCVGSAVISGIALGRYRDYTEVHRFQRAQRITFPIDEHVRLYREFFPVFEDCYYALSEINRYLDRL